MATTTGTGAKKIDNTDDWRDIFDIHNDTVDAYDGKIGTTALPTTAQTITGAIDEHESDISALNSKIAKYYYSKADVTLAGNSDTTINVPLPSSYTQILAIIPVGYNVASTWNTTLVIKGVDNAGSASVRTNGSTQQGYAIWFWVIYR